MDIEAARSETARLRLPLEVEAELRTRTRLRATHYSTRIEGNRLTLEETQRVLSGDDTFRGRERDVAEVQHYWTALLRAEEWAAAGHSLTEALLQRLHGLVMRGSRAGLTPYRDGQNVIRDADSRAIVYLPPEAHDVPRLMVELIAWVRQATRDGVPAPVVAGLAHYQFVTIHPYYDGNGRTARLLATCLLALGGYGLRGLYSLEELHAEDLPAYYRALTTHPHHNYYEGRAAVELTDWLDYFIGLLATACESVCEAVARHGREAPEPRELQRLDTRARIVVGLLAHSERITAREVAAALGLSQRMARLLLQRWVADGLLVVTDPSRRGRAYALSAMYRQVIGNHAEQV